MKRFYYITFTLLCIAVLSWVLPWLVSLCFPQSDRDPFVGFSPVNDKFIVSLATETGEPGKVEYKIWDVDPVTGETTTTYTTEERDSLLPEIYANQLASKGLMPDSLNGVEMTMHNIRRNRWMFNSQPRNLNRAVPHFYPLMESMPKRFDLENPTVALYLPGEVQVIDMETNSIDSLKTRRFAKMFADRGFVFPAKEATANVTVRKAYDNGYLLIDANNDLYHLKMQANRPSMARIDHPADITPAHVFVLENADRALYGIVTTLEGRTFVIARDDYYSLIELPGVVFNPETDRMTIIKNLFSWVIKVNDGDKSTWTALSSDDLSLIGSYSYEYPANTLDLIEPWIFPFTTSFTTGNDYLVYPRIADFSWRAVFLNIVLALILAVVLKRRESKCVWPKLIVTVIFGIFAFIPLILKLK